MLSSTDSDLEADLWSMLCCIVTKKRITPYSLIVNIALTFKESSFDNWVKDVEWCEHICSAFLWPGLVMVLINFTSVLFQWCQIKPPVTSRWDEGKKKNMYMLIFLHWKKKKSRFVQPQVQRELQETALCVWPAESSDLNTSEMK